MRTATTMAALAALAWLPPASTRAGAQETVEEALEAVRGPQEPPTIEEAIGDLEREGHLAVYILRQVDRWHEPYPRPAVELDAFADRVAAIAADATLPEDMRWTASGALLSATVSKAEHGFGGTPYHRAFDLLVQVYEGGYDKVLHTVWLADSVRGPVYVQELFERSEPPPVCRWDDESGRYEPPECRGFSTFHETTWCEAGFVLYWDTVWKAMQRTPSHRLVQAAGDPRPVPEGLPEHIEDWHRRCR